MKKEQDATVSLPCGEGENKKTRSALAAGSGIARCPWLGLLVWQLSALLDHAQRETLPWSLSSTAAPGWDQPWQTASSCILLGCEFGALGLCV